MLSEPRAWTLARQERMKQVYPELGLQSATPDSVLGTDSMRIAGGQMPSKFTQSTVHLANHAADNG